MRSGRKSEAQTKAPIKDRIKGSAINKKGSASSVSRASSIVLSNEIIEALSKKADDFNQENKKNKVSLNTLKAVFRRGAGAFSTSHRPNMTRNGWAYARVNKFLEKKGGKEVKKAYIQDDDLLENGGSLGQEITCHNCGWQWNTKDSDESDKYVCHKCGFDNTLFYSNDIMSKGGLIAPNGNLSNLTPDQYKLVRTPQFKAWFGDWENDPQNASKVVDENGEPLVVYRGFNKKSDKGFTFKYNVNRFKNNRKTNKFGHYFTISEIVAKEYAEQGEKENDDDIIIKSYFLNIKSLLDITKKNKRFPNFQEWAIEREKGMMYSNYKLVERLKKREIPLSSYLLYDADLEVKDKNNLDELSDAKIKILEKKIAEQEADLMELHNSSESISLPALMHIVTGESKELIDERIKSLQDVSSERDEAYVNRDVYEWFIKYKYPLVIENLDDYLKKLIIDYGYDGVKFVEHMIGSIRGKTDTVYVTFESNQIKLADGTNTTFDMNKADIRYKEGGQLSIDDNGLMDSIFPEVRDAFKRHGLKLEKNYAFTDGYNKMYLPHTGLQKNNGNVDRVGITYYEDGYEALGDIVVDVQEQGGIKINIEFPNWQVLETFSIFAKGGQIDKVHEKLKEDLINDSFKSHKEIEQIAEEKGVELDYAKEQLRKGMQTESEHSNDTMVQEIIALQHLDEMIDYYEKLEYVEAATMDKGGVVEFNKNFEARINELKKEYQYDGSENDLSKINMDVAVSYMQYLAKSIGEQPYQWDWENESKNPTDYFQIEMQLESGNILRAFFIYVDNNHKVVKSKSNVKLYDNDYNEIKVLVEEPKFKSLISEYNFDYKGYNFEIVRIDKKWKFFGKYIKNFQSVPEMEDTTKANLVSRIEKFTNIILDENNYEKGGQIDPDNKKTKDMITHKAGNAGGLLVGNRHSEGGIKAVNKSTNSPLEMEGGEVVITRNAVSDNEKREFEGEMLTNREILSKINESGGGVSFEDGGKVDYDCECDDDDDDDDDKMANGGDVKVGDTLTDKNRVKFKVVEFDPKFGGRVRVERLDEYSTGTISDFRPLSKFNLQNKTNKGAAKKNNLSQIEDYLETLESNQIFDICSDFYTEDKEWYEVQNDLDKSELIEWALDYCKKNHLTLQDIKSMVSNGYMSDGGIVTLYDDYDKSAGYIIEKGNKYWTGKNWSDVKAYAESYKTKKEAEQKLKSTKMADGGEMEDEGVDLFEDYDNIPSEVQNILDKHSAAFEDGDYKKLEKANNELKKIGYTFEYGLDGTAYDLRKIGQKGKSDEEFAHGGDIDWGADLGDGFSVGNDITITDRKSPYFLADAGIIGKVGKDFLVNIYLNEGTIQKVMSKNQFQILEAPEYANGGSINSDLSDKELKDLVERLSKVKTLDKREEYALMKAKYMLDKRGNSNKYDNGGKLDAHSELKQFFQEQNTPIVVEEPIVEEIFEEEVVELPTEIMLYKEDLTSSDDFPMIYVGSSIYANNTNGSDEWVVKSFSNDGVNLLHIPSNPLAHKHDDKHISFDELTKLFKNNAISIKFVLNERELNLILMIIKDKLQNTQSFKVGGVVLADEDGANDEEIMKSQFGNKKF